MCTRISWPCAAARADCAAAWRDPGRKARATASSSCSARSPALYCSPRSSRITATRSPCAEAVVAVKATSAPRANPWSRRARLPRTDGRSVSAAIGDDQAAQHHDGFIQGEVFLGDIAQLLRFALAVVFLRGVLAFGAFDRLALLLAVGVLLTVGQAVAKVGLTHREAGLDAFQLVGLQLDVRRDAFRLDAAPIRRVVTRGGELDGAIIGQGQDGLHRALAEGLAANDDGAVVVLQRARDDFRGRGRAAVDQHHDGHAGHQITLLGIEIAFLAFFAAADGNHLAAVEEGIRDFHRRVQYAARVVAEVDDNAAQSITQVRADRGDFFAEVVAGVVGKGTDADVANILIQNAGAHAGHLDDVAGDADDDRLRLAFARDGQFDVGTRLAAHLAHGFGQGHALDRGVVDFDDQVACLDAGTLCRGVVDRRDHAHQAILHLHFDAEPAELPLRGGGDVLELLRIQVSRMRVEAAEHAADRVLQQLAVGDILDVAILYA